MNINPEINYGTEFAIYYEGIRSRVKANGKLINKAQSDWGADVYELKGIRVAETDVGYGSQVYSDSFSFYGDYRTNPIQYSINSYQSNLTYEEKESHLPTLQSVWTFLTISTEPKDWKDTLSDDFWLHKFQTDYPEGHFLQ